MINSGQIERLNSSLIGSQPEVILRLVLKEFGGKIGFSTSLGAEDQVITAILAGIDKSINIFTLDTGRMFPETYEVLHRTVNRYGMNIKVYFPESSKVEDMVNSKGINLFYENIGNRKLCCHIRKIEPLQRALSGLNAWITGLRRQQSVTRQEIKLVEWTNEMVWDYIHQYNVPYNKLHDQGFPSIGCQPCTRAILKGEDIRAGRWWWELPDSKECGLHQKDKQ